MKTSIIVLITVAILLFAFDYILKSVNDDEPEVISKSHSLKRQDFSLPDLSGQQQQFSQWNNKVVLLNFWATWCPPCRREMPDFIEVYKQYKDKDFVIIGVGVDDQTRIAQFVKTLGVNYPILVGGQTAMQVSYQYCNVSGALPYSILIDKHGIIRYRAGGLISKQKLINQIEPLL
ncbi:MAG: TlpA family protein disulfide reductase [gamma proteobacterium symbiont of Bathyaustriella thionipta]|nr:TlpA family protein disulfide reductase [gamma proteobacterium symbiont of Bathyaustriella thionipta]MCU7948756.1 TlpA family protein disulfide reductase [gamma proteobacterium symbiont of Bathyaustriella thionipta]MCU7953548.1 TlpA family protein disulfide reductase [gamma proteobacterium symbiont of Bathyaustriella thionipta]MCU7955239.1 TlpA family protein disulfide reductase [gamma proteobacterium symbiont of Bathyaustriella thionipta]MCU7967025.1 TlpA family protein disulfide reductase 